MTRKYAVLLCVAIIVALLLAGCPAAVKNPFLTIQPTVDDSYGYSDENPVRIGYYKEIGRNITLCKNYIRSLRTLNGESLEAILRVSVEDPKYDPSYGTFLGLHRRGDIAKGGFLDLYTLVPESGSDTVNLYFDIYHAEPLLIPKGLLFVEPEDSTSGVL
jgi:hypothetical protein